MSGAVRATIEGLEEAQHGFGRLDADLDAELRPRLRRVAELVAALVRVALPKLSGAASRSVRVGNLNGRPIVEMGAKVPYTAWLDFGGRLLPVGRRHGLQYRPRVAGGRYLFPTVERLKPQTHQLALEAFEVAKKRAGLNR